ncbi:MAG: hypothetical protein PHF17_08360 [Arcobacteraceae bacterium]|nr:hypothetical protein [Arcobacteraceae bacterium]
METLKLFAEDCQGVEIFEITKDELYVDQDGDLLCMSSRGELHEIDYYTNIKLTGDTTLEKLKKNIRDADTDKKVKFEDMKYLKF